MARYERIAAALRDSILDGQYEPGERLPRQRELARIWQTTLPTVRQALDQLQQDGLIRVEHGVGTFVADLDLAYDPFAMPSFTEALRERGLVVETRLLTVDSSVFSAAAADALGVTESEGLVALTRVRLVAGIPIVYQHSYAPGRLRGELADYDGMIPLYAFLRDQAGIVAGAYRETIIAATASDKVAAALAVVHNSPILVAQRITATAHGQPFLYDEAHLPPERIQVTITRQGTRCVVELSPVRDDPAGAGY